MQPASRTASALEPYLRSCGYVKEQLAIPFQFDNVTVPIAAFACKPWDSWTACIAIVDANGDSKEAAAKVHPLGAPSVFACHADGVDWWAQGLSGPTTSRRIRWQEIGPAFKAHKSELSPSRIYSAKLHKSDAKASQLWFFDAGLMPAVERNRGKTLVRLIEQVIGDLHGALGSQLNSRQAQEDVYRTVFWLLAAKVLHDKKVPNFIKIDLRNVKEVFERIGRHHGERGRFPPFGKAGRPAIDAAAVRIATCGSLADVSSESLAYLNENTLIDKAAGGKRGKKTAAPYDIRKELGIHSTPSVLINHMLSQLWPLIKDINEDDRHVFEPACGHAPFLTAAMRWLRDWGKSGSSSSTHDYLRTHLHGLEEESFSEELARLSLTVADEPHGNSWEVKKGDMFKPGVLAKYARKCTILLANPPYEPFDDAAKKRYKQAGEPVTAITKAVEMLNRTLRNLPPGGVFGVVVPQGVLHDKESLSIRDFVLNKCELREVAVFADNLFEHSDHEVAVLIGRRCKGKPATSTLMYRRVREGGMEAFKERLEFSSGREVAQTRFAATKDLALLLPDLPELWDYLGDLPRLQHVANIQQGFQFLGKEELKGREVVSRTKRPGWIKAVLRADDGYNVWEAPRTEFIDADRKNIRTPGPLKSLGIPQVIVNYNPVSRDPWRVKPMIDEVGLAVSSNFVVFRPTQSKVSLRVIWAVLNSPIANAYSFCWAGKRHTLVKEWRAFPMPAIPPERQRAIEDWVNRYFAAAKAADEAFMREKDENAIRNALLRVDAEVLKLYNLSPRLERRLLDLFPGVERKGVGCKFGDYFPADFKPYIPLHEYISEEYQRSTAGELSRNFQPVRSKAALAALDLAEKLAAGY